MYNQVYLIYAEIRQLNKKIVQLNILKFKLKPLVNYSSIQVLFSVILVNRNKIDGCTNLLYSNFKIFRVIKYNSCYNL